MINLNGNIVSKEQANLSLNNRGLTYGDAVFETLKVCQGNILFWEDHYFRLMASMRILRMEIPMTFTLEFIEEEVKRTLDSNELLQKNARVKIFVNRSEGGLYSPTSNVIDYMVMAEALSSNSYTINSKEYKVDLFKDFFISPGLLSTLKTNNRVINVIGSIYANENDLHNCLLLNTDKSVTEALNANVFLVKDNFVKTPPLEDGCLNGIMRKQILKIIKSIPELELHEGSISPFELQKADELFLTNVIVGIQPISQYRKKRFKTTVSELVLEKLNKTIGAN